ESVIKIKRYDNIFMELYTIFNAKKDYKNRQKMIKSINNSLNTNNSVLNILDTYNNETKKSIFE
ncbi:MAG TPA: hypothetical protein PK771_14910, partial [Spirochaetota bacterium]|nr:hypothetical protein [Spirochaetota bacterium]